MRSIKARAGGDLNTDYVLVVIAEQAMSMSMSRENGRMSLRWFGWVAFSGMVPCVPMPNARKNGDGILAKEKGDNLSDEST